MCLKNAYFKVFEKNAKKVLTLKTNGVILVSRCAKKKLILNVFRKQICQIKKIKYFLKKGIDIIFLI